MRQLRTTPTGPERGGGRPAAGSVRAQRADPAGGTAVVARRPRPVQPPPGPAARAGRGARLRLRQPGPGVDHPRGGRAQRRLRAAPGAPGRALGRGAAQLRAPPVHGPAGRPGPDHRRGRAGAGRRPARQRGPAGQRRRPDPLGRGRGGHVHADRRVRTGAEERRPGHPDAVPPRRPPTCCSAAPAARWAPARPSSTRPATTPSWGGSRRCPRARTPAARSSSR